MPLIFEKELPGSKIGVWQILEDEAELISLVRVVSEDLKKVSAWKNGSRRKQWLACRILLGSMLRLPVVGINYDDHGKPSLAGFAGHISFSHTAEYAAVMVNSSEPAGIDIEKILPRIERVAGRFLQEDELMNIRLEAGRRSPDNDDENGFDPYTQLLCTYWCAKEALYKFYGKPVIDLKNDIHISSFNYFCNPQATFAASVTSPEGVDNHELQFERIGDHMLVYTV